MRVCMLSMLLPVHATGGMEIHSLDLAKGLAKAGHHVTIITSRHPAGKTRETTDGVDIHYSGSKPTSRTPLGADAARIFESLHAQKGFDVVHSQSGAAFCILKNGLKDRLAVPLVTTIHGTPGREIMSILRQGPSLMLAPKVIFHMYGYLRWARPLLRSSDAVICVSEEVSAAVTSEFGIRPPRVRTVHNGVDTDVFRPLPREQRGRGKEGLILSVSLLHRQKGIQYLLKAFSKVGKHTRCRLLIIGDGPYAGELRRLAKSLGTTERVEFKGRMPNAELRDHYNACDVFVMPSFGVEGLPLVALEAMSCGKPVIASSIGGMPSVVEDGKNGYLVKPRDVGSLAERISAVLGNEQEAARMGAEAQRSIEKSFSREKMVKDTLRVYESVIG